VSLAPKSETDLTFHRSTKGKVFSLVRYVFLTRVGRLCQRKYSVCSKRTRKRNWKDN